MDTEDSPLDLLVIGGGINGAGIARDAAGRGLRVALVEQGDFAGATSSASSKLIHGGLRYLEHYDFGLVAHALAERAVLLRLAPHLVRPLRFVMPHVTALRPAWMIRAGLWLYDRLGGTRHLPRSEAVSLLPDGLGAALDPRYQRGFAYWDACVDDARLVILNLRSAQEHGAQILPRTRFLGATRTTGGWHARLQTEGQAAPRSVRVRALVNAAGPWVATALANCGNSAARATVQLVKGSHIVVPRVHAREHAYILQHNDGRVIFMLPYEQDFTLIGTTDLRVAGPDGHVAPDAGEVAYLLDAVNRYLARPLSERDVVWRYSGVRPLYDDGSADPARTTRDYHLALEAHDGAALLTVYGGKITTYRRLAQEVLALLRPHLDASQRLPGPWTQGERLPGAPPDLAAAGQALRARYPQLPASLCADLLRRHGTLAQALLGDATTPASLGRAFGAGLYEREVDWLRRHEWALRPDDVLWRRTKCGLHMSAAERDAFATWFA